MEASIVTEEGAADISVTDNLFGKSVTSPNLSVGDVSMGASDTDQGPSQPEQEGKGAHRREVEREVHFGIWKGCPIASKLPYDAWNEKWV